MRGPKPTYVVIDELYHFTSNSLMWLFWASQDRLLAHFSCLDADDE